MAAGSMSANGQAKNKCPECGRPTVEAHKPFCSARCRQIDLGRWLKGDYVIPGDPVGPDDLSED